jgi:Secretion system C-terminal sorting domain/Domain of unknown function (DUF5060)
MFTFTPMKQIATVFLFLFLSLSKMSAVAVSTPNFTKSTFDKYEKAEASFTIGATYANNYDPSVVQVDAEITKPSGATVTFPCFYYVPCTFAAQSATFWQATENSGGASWLLRFAPSETGTYSVRIKVTENGSTVSYSLPRTFTVVAGSGKGFVRLDAANNQFMRFDNNTPYYPVGTNVAWNDQTLTQYYQSYFSNISNNGMTWTRYWLTDFARQALEWKASHWSNWYSGLGQYSQKAAALLDNVLDQCAAKGCYMQLVLQHHGQFSNSVNAEWSDNPYNSSNGGPLSSASQFFNNTTAKAQTKKQYRYIVARWGFSTHILAWEFFNEVNYTDGVATEIDTWHDEMGLYIKSLDIHNHIVTTSTHNSNALLASFDNNTGLDQLQFHYYGTNLETSILTAAQTVDALISKPLMSGEFGYDNSNYLNDNTADHARKAMWVNMMNRIPTQFWFWQEYIIPKNLHNIFTPLSNFMSSVDVVNQTNAVGGALTFQNNPGGSGTGLTLATQNSGFLTENIPNPWTGTIDAAGNCTNINGLGRYLYGSDKGNSRDVSFTANFTATGTAAINLRGSSNWGSNYLEIYLDGSLQNTYYIANSSAGTYTLTGISAGSHTIKFRSSGQDWVEITSFAFTNVSQTAALGNCVAHGYVGTQKAYGFVYDKSYGEWAATASNVTGASLRFTMNVGNYAVEFWNPQTGATTNGGLVATNGAGVLVLNLPTFNKDVAFKISFQSPVPLELLSFDGNTEGSSNRLNWLTANEINTANFQIERSADGQNDWKTIGELPAKGNSQKKENYFLYDKEPLSIGYYRLKTNDLDGQFTYSKTIVLKRSTKGTLKVYPNVTENDITIAFENGHDIKEVNIVDMSGRVWVSQKVKNTEGYLNRFDVSQFPSGVYVVVLKTNQSVLTERFVKQ